MLQNYIDNKPIKFEQNIVPVEKDTFYEEQTNSENNRYSSRDVSVRVTPNGIERSERFIPNKNYHKRYYD